MNNERYNQIIDEAYKKHINSLFYDFSGEVKGYLLHEHLSKEEFINKCKTDSEFSEKWGLKIEERELSLEERQRLCSVYTQDSYGIDGELRSPITIDWEKTPKRAIILTYNNKTIKVYE
jgi:hypothetical protein